MNSAARIILAFAGSLSLNSCLSYTQEIYEIRSLYRGEQYESALSRLESSNVRDQERNRLLYHLERATILDRMGRRKESRSEYLNADRIADELYTVSITKTAASFVVNDSTSDYDGEDYEKVAIHTMLALSFLEDNELKSARIEARKINSKLQEINGSYEENVRNRYSEDAFARYLSGIIYEALNEFDSAIIDYRAALKAYNSEYKPQFNLPVPAELVRSLHQLLLKRGRRAEAQQLASDYSEIKMSKLDKNEGQIVVIHEAGIISSKRSNEYIFPIGSQIVRFSFPVIYPESGSFGATGVSVNGVFHKSALVQDMDAIAIACLDDRRGRMIVKQGARLIVKGQLVESARKQFGPLGGLVANATAAATETADTRSWTSLPARFYVTKFDLPAGTYTVKSKTNGDFVADDKVTVRPGELIIIRARPGKSTSSN